jgi:diguanylate cyclase (GGDEF)-like protein
LILILACTAGGFCAPAQASCVELASRPYDQIAKQVGKDPRQAQSQARAALANPRIPAESRALLLASAAEAAGRLTENEEAQRNVGQGLAIAPAGSPARAELLWLAATNTFRREELLSLKPEVEKELIQHRAGSSAQACLLLALGTIERMQGDFAASARHLTTARRQSELDPQSDAHVEAMRLLSRLMAASNNFSDALNLNQSVIDAERQRGNAFLVGLGHGFQGIYLNGDKRFGEAIGQLDIALGQARRFRDRSGEAHLAMHLCRAHIGMSHWRMARPYCELAAPAMKKRGDDAYYQTQTFLAQIDLAENRPRAAQARLREVLRVGMASSSVNQYEPYRLSSEARYRLGDIRGAYADLSEYAERYGRWSDAAHDRDLHVTSERLQTDLQILKNAELQKELIHERARAEERARINALMFFAGVAIIALLALLYWIGLRHRRKLHLVATTDELTGLWMRRHFLEQLTEAVLMAEKQGTPLSLALVDIDHFKAINDRFGHPAGDQVLRELGKLFRDTLPQEALIGRWGGEEFMIALPNTDMAAATAIIETLRLRTQSICPNGDCTQSVGFSAGLAIYGTTATAIDEMISRADQALYKAKATGRGRSVIDDQAAPPSG